jgi:hypothetical protein
VNTQTSSYVIYIKLPTLRQGKYLEYVLVYPVDTAVESCKKTPEFLEESTLSGAKKHPDFQVTSWSCSFFVRIPNNASAVQSNRAFVSAMRHKNS